MKLIANTFALSVLSSGANAYIRGGERAPAASVQDNLNEVAEATYHRLLSEQPTQLFNGVQTNLTHSAGTAAKVSPDGSLVFITADDGSLVIANATSGGIIDTKKNGVSCDTGVAISPDGLEVMYTVRLDTAGKRSEIFAYSIETLAPTWSHEVEGQLPGAPVYGRNSDYVYFTHNFLEGHFTVLNIDGANATSVYTASLTDTDVGPPKGVNKTLITGKLTWSGVAIAFNPQRNEEIEDNNGTGTGKFQLVDGSNSRFGRTGNTNDFVVWAHLAEDGARTSEAYYYSFQLPMDDQDPNEVIALGSSSWAVFRPPVLSSNGVRMGIAGQRGAFRGWTEPALLTKGANIKVNLERGQRDGPNPSYSTPSITPDDSMMFFASTKNAIYGIKADEPTPADDGSGTWTSWLWGREDLDSVVTAGTQPSADGANLFVITSSGMAHKLNAKTGADAWTSVDAPGPVEADFSVSGNSMFFVTKDGVLSGWRVDDGATSRVTTDAPTSMPTTMPTNAVEMGNSTSAPTESPVIEETTASPVGDNVTTDTETTASPVGDNVTTDEPEDTEVPTSSPVESESTATPTASPVKSDDTVAPTGMPTTAALSPTASPVKSDDTVAPTGMPTTAALTEEPTTAPSSAVSMSNGMALLISALGSCVFVL